MSGSERSSMGSHKLKVVPNEPSDDTGDVAATLRSRLGATPEIGFSYEPGLSTLVVTMEPRPYPRLTEGMTESFMRLAAAISDLWGSPYPSRDQPIKFVILRSDDPATFSSGGDLTRILAWLEVGDAAAMRGYFHNGTKSFHALASGFGASIVTVAAVSGKALGGGFEAARACDYIVADGTATFCFPEARFGLFPGNGSVSLVGLRHGEALMRRLVIDGAILDADGAAELGIVEPVVPEGQSFEAAKALVATLLPKHAACLAIRRGMQSLQGLTLEGMLGETERYLSAAIGMGADLAAIRRIVSVQDRAAARAARR